MVDVQKKNKFDIGDRVRILSSIGTVINKDEREWINVKWDDGETFGYDPVYSEGYISLHVATGYADFQERIKDRLS